MSQEIKLTEDEKAQILAIRKEKKAKGQLRQEAYDKNIISQTEYKQKCIEKKVKENQALVNAYEKYYSQLLLVNPNYKLVTEDIEFSEIVKVQKLEYIDDEGNNIWKDSDGDFLNDSKTKEVITTLTAKGVTSIIKYVGSDVPKGCNYRVQIDVTDNGGRHRTNLVYKMQYKGTNVDYTDGNRKYTVAKTVNERIIQHVEWKKAEIEREIQQNSLKTRALAKAKSQYINSNVILSEYYIRNSNSTYDMLIVTLSNGIEVELTFSERDNVIKFSIRDIRNKHSISADGLIGALAKISPKEA